MLLRVDISVGWLNQRACVEEPFATPNTQDSGLGAWVLKPVRQLSRLDLGF